MSPKLLWNIALGAAVLCVVAGIAYLLSPFPEDAPLGGPPALLILAAGLVGGIALAAAGWWQKIAPQGDRALPLTTLSALGAGYTLANVAGMSFRELGTWRAPLWIGLPVGAVLFLSALGSLLGDQRTRHAQVASARDQEPGTE